MSPNFLTLSPLYLSIRQSVSPFLCPNIFRALPIIGWIRTDLANFQNPRRLFTNQRSRGEKWFVPLYLHRPNASIKPNLTFLDILISPGLANVLSDPDKDRILREIKKTHRHPSVYVSLPPSLPPKFSLYSPTNFYVRNMFHFCRSNGCRFSYSFLIDRWDNERERDRSNCKHFLIVILNQWHR